MLYFVVFECTRLCEVNNNRRFSCAGKQKCLQGECFLKAQFLVANKLCLQRLRRRRRCIQSGRRSILPFFSLSRFTRMCHVSHRQRYKSKVSALKRETRQKSIHRSRVYLFLLCDRCILNTVVISAIVCVCVCVLVLTCPRCLNM